MFFALSKILAFLICPINWILFFMLLGIFVPGTGRKRVFRILAVAGFLFFTNGFIAGKILGLWEVDTVARHELDTHYDAGILLGGMVNFQSDSTLVSFNQNGDRLFQTMELYRSGKIDKILISSGSGLLQLPSFKEAYLAKRYLLSIGFPEEDILIETRSRNTHENAVMTKEVLTDHFGSLDGRNFLLITSASHMRRAMGCFRKEGVPVQAYSTTKRGSSGPFVFTTKMILPDPYALEQWNIFFYELAGTATYRLQGYL